jgi:anti-anti-sigma factor
MAEPAYLFTRYDSILFFKFTGELKYTHSVGFDYFLEQLMEKNDFDHAVFDLTEAEYIDSTNLGLMAKLAVFMKKQDKPVPTIISTNDNINQILESVNFGSFFKIIREPETSFSPEDEIPKMEGDRKTSTKMIIDAHKNLIRLSKENEETFQDIVSLLEEEARQEGSDKES